MFKVHHPFHGTPRLTQGFGYTSYALAHPKLYANFGGKHPGHDWDLNYETVYAPFDGEVVRIRPESDSYGRTIEIRSFENQNIKALHAHLSNIYVGVGRKVKQGEMIARSGNSGPYTTGPHLHFELRDMSKATLPEQVFEPIYFNDTNMPVQIYWADFVGQGYVDDKGVYKAGIPAFKPKQKVDLWFECKNTGNVDWPLHDNNSVRISTQGWTPFTGPWITPQRICEVEKFYWKTGICKPQQQVKFRGTFIMPDYPTEIKGYPIYMLMENVAWFNDVKPVFKVDFSIK